MATGLVDVDDGGGDGADVATGRGGADDDGLIGDVARRGAVNGRSGGRWGADPGCDSPGGTLFPLLLAVLLAVLLVVAESVVVVVVESVVCGRISLAWLT